MVRLTEYIILAIMRELNKIRIGSYPHTAQLKDKRLICGIRSGSSHAREGEILNPMLKQMFGDSRTYMTQDAWIIYQLLAHILT